MSIKPRKQRRVYITKSGQRRRTVRYYPNKTKRVIPWITHTVECLGSIWETNLIKTWAKMLLPDLEKEIANDTKPEHVINASLLKDERGNLVFLPPREPEAPPYIGPKE